MTDPGPRSVRRNICLYAALVSPCAGFFFFSPLFFLSFFLACLSSPLFAPILFLSIPSRYERPDSPTPAPISPVEANYLSQVVEGLKRSFFLIFFSSFFPPPPPPPPPPISPKPERWMRTKSGSATEALSAVIKYGRKCC